MTTAAHEDVTLNAATRSKTKKALATPDIAASPLAIWTARTLVDPGNAGVPVAANYAPKTPARPADNAAVSEFVLQRQSIARFVRDALQDAVDKQKQNADKRGRKNMATFETGDQVLLSTDGIWSSAVTNRGASKLAPRFIGPFSVMKVNGEAYTMDIPTSLRLHPTFYVGHLKKYHAATIPSTNPPAPERRASGPHDAQSSPPTGEVELPPAALRKHASPAGESAPAAPDSTGAPPQAPSEPAPLGASPFQPLPERPTPDSQLPPGHLGLPKRTSYRRLLTRLVIRDGSWIILWRTRTSLVLRLIPVSVRVVRSRTGFLPRRSTGCVGLAFHRTTIHGSHAPLSTGMFRTLFASTRTRSRATTRLSPTFRRPRTRATTRLSPTLRRPRTRATTRRRRRAPPRLEDIETSASARRYLAIQDCSASPSGCSVTSRCQSASERFPELPQTEQPSRTWT
ncbi:hypothetical protein PF003_g920 [Phytophthora fragariae]|nr:hypothetical protein PF003_g920 [Phytophthora fragariae]